MEQLQKLLQVSAKIYSMLGNLPGDEEREVFISNLNTFISERDEIAQQLLREGFKYNSTIKSHETLFELDKGIIERLEKFMSIIKQDMKDLQNSKKNEQQYLNPYSQVQTIDGMYYDKKK